MSYHDDSASFRRSLALREEALSLDLLATVLPPQGVFDTRKLLDSHPELKVDKSIVLDVIYEEYCRRKTAGEIVDTEEFCERFPTYQASVCRLLQVSEFVEDDFFFTPKDYYLGFRLNRQLGRGRFARVFLATEPSLGDRQVAVKFSRNGTIEASTLGRLSHPHVVPIHSVQTDPDTGMSAVCMPYLGNATLLDVLDRVYEAKEPPVSAEIFRDVIQSRAESAEAVENPLPPDPLLGVETYVAAVTKLGAELADALHYVHLHGIFHQDFKPSNVLLASGGRPLLLDFNLSIDKRLSDCLRGGTPWYMAPEQLRMLLYGSTGDTTPADARSDVYALGIVLYELLAGRHPFGPTESLPAAELADLILQRMAEPLRPLQDLNPRVTRRLARTVERCLANRLEDRPHTAEEVALALRSCLPLRRRLGAWARQRPLRAAVASVALTVTLTGGAAYGMRDLYLPPAPTIESNPELQSPEENLRRAQELQRARKYDKALIHYAHAGTLLHDAVTLSCVGYCLSQTNYHVQADHRYRQADRAGNDTAAMWNNRAYSLLTCKRNEQPWLPLAYEAINRAIERDPRSQAAFYNRALLHSEIVRQKLDRDPVSGVPGKYEAATRALQDIRKAIQLGPASAELLLDAARIAATEGSDAEAFSYLKRAIDGGVDPRDRDLKNDRAFPARFRVDPQFGNLTQRPWSGIVPNNTDRLIDPLPS